MNNLKSLIENTCINVKGQKAIIVYDLQTNNGLFINADLIFPAASLIKLSILLTLFEKEAKKEICLEDRYTLDKKLRAGGFGVLKNMDYGLRCTLKDLAVLMITVSDNIASNVLIKLLSMHDINLQIQLSGMKNTILSRYMMDEQAKLIGLDNYTSARDIMYNFLAIKHSAKGDIMLDILSNQQLNNKLSETMPDFTRFAHKTGELPGVEHDAGILYVNEKEILLIVLTNNLYNNLQGVYLHRKLGKIVYDFFNHNH